MPATSEAAAAAAHTPSALDHGVDSESNGPRRPSAKTTGKRPDRTASKKRDDDDDDDDDLDDDFDARRARQEMLLQQAKERARRALIEWNEAAAWRHTALTRHLARLARLARDGAGPSSQLPDVISEPINATGPHRNGVPGTDRQRFQPYPIRPAGAAAAVDNGNGGRSQRVLHPLPIRPAGASAAGDNGNGGPSQRVLPPLPIRPAGASAATDNGRQFRFIPFRPPGAPPTPEQVRRPW